MSEEQQLVRLGRSLFDRGLTHGRTGNLSFRRDDGFVVTPTGSSLGTLDDAALSVVALDGTHRTGPPPTKEAFLHAAVYGARPDAGAIVHLHATYAVAVSCLGDRPTDDVLPALTAYYVMRIGRCPLVGYAPPGDASAAPEIARVARDHHALLLANHGPVVAGPDLGTAVDAIEELEETARLFLLLSGHTTRPLSATQIAAVSPAAGAGRRHV